jgi:hypothetical protein
MSGALFPSLRSLSRVAIHNHTDKIVLLLSVERGYVLEVRAWGKRIA